MTLKSAATHKYWDDKPVQATDYTKVDAATLKLFTGTHPKVVQDWLLKADGIFQADPNYRLSSRKKNITSC